MIRTLVAVLLAAVSAAAAAQAPANPPVRIRGTVASLDGQILTVKARNGESLKLKLAETFLAIGSKKASIHDIAGDLIIGTTIVRPRTGSQITDVGLLIPDRSRGIG